MKKRLLTTAIGLPVLFLVLYAYHTVFFDVVLLAACVLGYYEAFRAYGQKHTTGLLITISVLSAVSWLGMTTGCPLFSTAQSRELSNRVLIFVLIAALIIFTLRHFQQIEIARVAGALLMCALLYFCFGTVLYLKTILPYQQYGYLGAFVLLLSLAYAWGGDSFAYLSGKAFGKRKMCPNISPNKTIAGALGAPVGSILFGLLFLCVYEKLMPVLQPHAILNFPAGAFWAVAIIAVPACLLGMGGDLYASCVKRQVGVKDYGTIFPGQGGILDRFDSVIPVLSFVAACAYVYSLLFL